MLPEDEPMYVGITQLAKAYYHKASNGNVSIMRLVTPLNWAEFTLKCSKCQAQHFIKDPMDMQVAIHEEIDKFCAEHQHKDVNAGWVSYKFNYTSTAKPVTGPTVTLSKEEYERLIGRLPKTSVEEEGRLFRKEDE